MLMEESVGIVPARHRLDVDSGKDCAMCGERIWCRKTNINKRKYCSYSCARSGKRRTTESQVNSTFFSEPDLINSFYAGFIAADGCIQSYQKRTPQVSITLEKEDKPLLDDFASRIEFKNSMHLVRDKYINLTIPSQTMVDDLFRVYNITARKTLTLEPPLNLNYPNSCAFSAGYVDGDGGYYIDERNNRPTMHVKGTEAVLTWMINFTEIKQSVAKVKDKKCYSLTLYGDTAIHFREHYVNMDLPFLERKNRFWEKAGADMTISGRSKSINYETTKASK